MAPEPPILPRTHIDASANADAVHSVVESLDRLAAWEGERWRAENDRRLSSFWNTDYLETIVIPKLHLNPGDEVVDVGCGMGALTLLLGRARPDVRFTGVDLSEPSVEVGARLAALMSVPNVSFRQGSALLLPFPDQSCAAVVCQTLLGHVSDPILALKEMKRVLRPGGVLLATEWAPHFWQDFSDYPGKIENQEALKESGRLWEICKKGKEKLGHGEEVIGQRVPLWLSQIGMRVTDVRLNDCAQVLSPPYDPHGDNPLVREMEGILTQPPYEGVMADEFRMMIRAGGGTPADEAAFLALPPCGPDTAEKLTALRAGTLYNLRLRCLTLTFGTY